MAAFIIEDKTVYLVLLAYLPRAWVGLEFGEYIIVSSAYKVTFKLKLDRMMVFMYNANSSGPRIDSCGTPLQMARRLVSTELDSTSATTSVGGNTYLAVRK